jgi:hypothetical protein
MTTKDGVVTSSERIARSGGAVRLMRAHHGFVLHMWTGYFKACDDNKLQSVRHLLGANHDPQLPDTGPRMVRRPHAGGEHGPHLRPPGKCHRTPSAASRAARLGRL